jgi:hypothetical protein
METIAAIQEGANPVEFLLPVLAGCITTLWRAGSPSIIERAA